MTNKKTKKLYHNTIHLVYKRQYEDSDIQADPYFFSYCTIFRNVPIRQLNKLNSESLKTKVKLFCDNNYKEQASNFTGVSEIEIITGDEYYKTYEDVYGKIAYNDCNLYYDYGQKWNTRQFFKYDYNPSLKPAKGREIENVNA
jgi:hypothetical protein|tara:strand:+ start:80 stop:508 length:429 start_codon:yes stop_codon:yes gene_type:complete